MSKLNTRMCALGFVTLLVPLEATARPLANSDVVNFHKSVGGLVWRLPAKALPPNAPDADRYALCVLKIRVPQVRVYGRVLALMNSSDVAESMRSEDDTVVAKQNVASEARELLHDILPDAKTQIQLSLSDCKEYSDVTYEGKRLITAIDASVVGTQSLLDKVADVPTPYTGGHDN